MGLRARLLVFGYPALELLTAWGLAMVIGWGWTLFAVFAGLPVGLLVMRSAGRGAYLHLQQSVDQGQSIPGASRYASRFAAGLLLAIPGLWSDLAGLLVLLPATGRWMMRRLPMSASLRTGSFAGAFTAFGQSGNATNERWPPDVVQGHVVNRPAGPPREDGPAGAPKGLPN